MPDWPVGIKSIKPEDHAHIPRIRQGEIERYVLYRQSSDLLSAMDIAGLKKGEKLLIESVAAFGYLQVENQYFFSGIVNASMKKKVQYATRLVVNHRGEIQNTDCEWGGNL